MQICVWLQVLEQGFDLCVLVLPFLSDQLHVHRLVHRPGLVYVTTCYTTFHIVITIFYLLYSTTFKCISMFRVLYIIACLPLQLSYICSSNE